jgi:methionyl-tRNA formyltransferase
LRIVFAGTPDFAVPGLRALIQLGCVIAGVYTQPDRPAGRGRSVSYSAVKRFALESGLSVFQPESLKAKEAQLELQNLNPDLLVVIAYGLILPKAVLKIPRYGCWNVHASLLPRWRGAAPIQRAIEAGDEKTGVCLMQMESGLDTGPVLLCQETLIQSDETSITLHERLACLGAEVLSAGVKKLALEGHLFAQPQSEAGVLYARKIEKGEALLDVSLSAQQLEQKIRAWIPWPIAELDLMGERVRIHEAKAMEETFSGVPGQVVRVLGEGIDVATGQGVLRLKKIQRAGGRVLSASDYVNAKPALRSLIGMA